MMPTGRRDALQAERDDLGRTVQALAERFDVGTRARSAARSARSSGMQAFDRTVRSEFFVPAAAGLGALLALAGGAIVLSGRDRPRS